MDIMVEYFKKITKTSYVFLYFVDRPTTSRTFSMQQDVKLTLLSEAINGAIHELNQPLTMMNFAAEALTLLAEHKPDSLLNDLRRIAEQIRNGAKRHHEILEYLRSLIQNNVVPQTLNLNETIKHTLQLLHSRLSAKQCIVKTMLNAPNPILQVKVSQLNLLIFTMIFSALNGVEKNANADDADRVQPEILFKTLQRKKTIELRCECTKSRSRHAIPPAPIDKTYAELMRSLAQHLGAAISFSLNTSRFRTTISIKFPYFSE
ncbi:MAG: hypothetical protein CMR00_05665 [[Chlorobium] sp. 445]|nr:MAG: hypothetical protein CMR00_05665 [[Chlorobium] sp. 445]